MNALLYQVEAEFGRKWSPVLCFVPGKGRYPDQKLWHDSLDSAVEHARKARDDDAKQTPNPHARSDYRVVDHLGIVHWPKHPDLLPPGEPGRCRLCKSKLAGECIAKVYKWAHVVDSEKCECECHNG